MNNAPAQKRLITIGEATPLLYNEHTGGLQQGMLLRVGVAGAESNVALTAAQLGTPSAWVGVLGNDAAGDLVNRRLLAGGVSTEFVRRSSSPTGLILRERRSALGSHVHYWRQHSAGRLLCAEDIPYDAINERTVVHLTGVTPALGEEPAAAAAAIADRALETGALVSLDVNFRRKLWDKVTARDELQRLATRADLVFATMDEAALLAGVEFFRTEEKLAEDVARAVQDMGPATVIIKQGKFGATALDSTGRVTQEPAPQVPCTDAVGAGDAFVGGYLHAHMTGMGSSKALRLAVRAGSWAVTVLGDSELPPTQGDLDAIVSTEFDIR